MNKTFEAAMSLQTLQTNRWREVRQYRDTLLCQCDVEINKRLDDGQDTEQWRLYRKQLRDLPQTSDDPHKLVWPSRPVA